MIKKLTCASALATALLATAAPAAGAAEAVRSPVPAAGAPGVALLSSLLGSLETGNPVTSLNTLLPTGVLGR
ncbi:hypothetical protein ACIG54_16880 [Streptomyces achromogenes]|uniref:Secreted protein n=1 Tax=Streptomyces achromogenes TaxID=67255 RepID=A0ABZ1KMI9_STRAH|nr:hypothetical protein [Streptomyces achromogenes]MCZ0205217.1 hypothetical protein [Streptomyces sp. UMAF16]